ncbi:DUF4147 domain-containing protein [bacterium]|nr:MAG: DUF4147 domain-containing protein [bacterium]
MGYVKNRATLLATGAAALREVVLDLAEAGLAAADPEQAVYRVLRSEGEHVRVAGRTIELARGGSIFVVGAGKATYPIAKALDAMLGARIARGAITCKYGQPGTLDHIDVQLASHPLPDAASVAAAARAVRMLDDVRPGDLVFACFTGGSSALFVSPVEGVTLADLAATYRTLLNSGADIFEINAVRKHLSTVKGGRLARRLPAGCSLVNLTVSDVIGDRLDYITDPTVPDTSSFADAWATLDKYRLWARLPEPVAAYLRRAPPQGETVRAAELAHLERTDVLLVKGDAACRGAAAAARERGLQPLLLSTFFDGESSALARNLIAVAKQAAFSGEPAAPPCVLIAGGETTVTVGTSAACGEAASGGPNQEFAVAAALALSETPGIVALGIDTDGTDGPTRYAGAIADGQTLAIARRNGVDLQAALACHDVTPALLRAGHIVETGATGTNVNDLKLVAVAPRLRQPDSPSQ